MWTTLLVGMFIGFIAGLVFAELNGDYEKAKTEAEFEDKFGTKGGGKRAR